jgi:hypothetical protein
MRSLEEIQAELDLAYAARIDLISGKQFSETAYSSAVSSRRYVRSVLSLADLNQVIVDLEAEKVEAVNGTPFRGQSYVKMIYRKGGV